MADSKGKKTTTGTALKSNAASAGSRSTSSGGASASRTSSHASSGSATSRTSSSGSSQRASSGSSASRTSSVGTSSRASSGSTGARTSSAASAFAKASSGRSSASQRTEKRDASKQSPNPSTTSAARGRKEQEPVGTYLTPEEIEKRKEAEEARATLHDEIKIIIALLLSLLLVLSYAGLCDKLGEFVNMAVFGMLGVFGYVFPFFFFVISVFCISNKHNRSAIRKAFYCLLMLMFITSTIQLTIGGFDAGIELRDYFEHSIPSYAGEGRTYGGFLGGMMCVILAPFVGKVGALCIMAAMILILFMLIAGKAIFTALTVKSIEHVAESRREREERRKLEYGRRGTSITADDLDGVDPDDEIFNLLPPEKKEEKESFIDSLMRRGMGLAEKRITDSPEYLDIVSERISSGDATDIGTHHEEPSVVDLDVTPEDLAQSAAGTEQSTSGGSASAGVQDGTGQAQGGVGQAQDGTGSAQNGAEVPFIDLDIVKNELERKFGGSANAKSPAFTEKRRINSESSVRTVMEDSEPVEETASGSYRAGTSHSYAADTQPQTVATIGEQSGMTAGAQSGVMVGAQRGMTVGGQSGITAGEQSSMTVGAQSDEPADRDVSDDFEAACRAAWNNRHSAGSQRPAYSVVDHADSRLRGPLKRTTAASGTYDTAASPETSGGSNDGECFVSPDITGSFDDFRKTDGFDTAAPDDTADIPDTHDIYGSDGMTGRADKAGRTSSGATCFTDLTGAYDEKPAPPAYIFPPIDLLNLPAGRSKGVSKDELDATVTKLQSTFESFGVGVRVTDATCGPTVTRYEITPDQGVKVKTITSLADDIKLALAAAEIRIEAPIPGKAAVGIEVPNRETSPVLLRELLESPAFREAQSNLTFAVGKDIAGKSICFDIGSMPHMLIAGATGSGKSVCINALIMSILYKAKPSDVKMIMIDPKRVELIGYNGIPHLLVPVVTDVKKASGALSWAIAEMDDRYSRFADAGVNNLASYNRYLEEKYYEEGNEGECPNRLPQIVIIVDELNDLMMTSNSKEVEAAICRLTQLARASGIHVVLATQRPSVNVITGTIKANIPSRIAFSVSSIVDSRTILDQAGAEKLLGKGDMLFYPQGYPKPVRLQGAFVSDKEVASVVSFIKSTVKEAKYNDFVSQHIEAHSSGDTRQQSTSVQETAQSAGGDDRDEFYADAGRFIIEKQKASIGMLQRMYKIGFNRAARIMDALADDGVVGPEEGTKPRRILMNLKQFEAFLNGEEPDDTGSVRDGSGMNSRGILDDTCYDGEEYDR